MTKREGWIAATAAMIAFAVAGVLHWQYCPKAPLLVAGVVEASGQGEAQIGAEDVQADENAYPVTRRPTLKLRSLADEKARMAKQMERAQAKLDKLGMMSEKEWADYQRKRFARREALKEMTKEERKEYYRKRQDWKEQMAGLGPDERRAFLEQHKEEMLPLEGEE